MEEKKEQDNNTQEEKKKVSHNGRFQKGHKKVGGRKPGTPNKYGSIRDRLKDIIMPYLNPDPDSMQPGTKTLITDIMKIDDPKDRADTIAKFLPYVVPRYSSTQITADIDRPVSEEDRLLDLDTQYKKRDTSLTLRSITIVDNDNGGEILKASADDLDDLDDNDNINND